VAVRLKRFLAPEWVLTLGMALSANERTALMPHDLGGHKSFPRFC